MSAEWGFGAFEEENGWSPVPIRENVAEAPRRDTSHWSAWHVPRGEANDVAEQAVPYSSSPLDFSTPPRHVNAQAMRTRLPSPASLVTDFAAFDANPSSNAVSASTSNRAQAEEESRRSQAAQEESVRRWQVEESLRRSQTQNPTGSTRRSSPGPAVPRDPFAALLQRQLHSTATPNQQRGSSQYGSDIASLDDPYQLDSTTGESEEEMPVTRRRQARQSNSNSVVDLTQSPGSTPQDSTRKRGAESGSDSEPSKRRKRAVPTRSTEVLDDDSEFANEAPGADDELVSAQQMDALKQQESGRDEGPVKMGKRTCIICLENFTNATVAHCGHIFCHECLIRALMASEKHSDRRIGNCPACRKPISRKKGITIIPINFMKASAFNTKGRGKELNV